MTADQMRVAAVRAVVRLSTYRDEVWRSEVNVATGRIDGEQAAALVAAIDAEIEALVALAAAIPWNWPRRCVRDRS